MQVILLKDIPKIGKKYDVVDVADGYAANMLLPKRLAERAIPSRVAELDSRKTAHLAAEDARRAALADKLAVLEDSPITITAKADEQGHLYKKVHAHDIAVLLKDEQGIALDDHAILLDTPLHELGDHALVIDVAGKKTTITVSIITE